MTELSCSVCWNKSRNLTMISGTVVCQNCVEKRLKESEAPTLKEKISDVIRKENDIYD